MFVICALGVFVQCKCKAKAMQRLLADRRLDRPEPARTTKCVATR